ncbi:MAG: hypothetical protein KatS3mg124_2331 [Porticoccaceae bacterium]|nr:MAG: hypothetical protein KatS3mg124_2331 [Porticoccaceae bacterium]
MSQTLIVVDELSDWAPFYPSDRVLAFADYLDGSHFRQAPRTRVINLCRNFRYLSDGYYCSLLAEARGHSVIPSVKVLNDLGRRALWEIELDEGLAGLTASLRPAEGDVVRLLSFFGTTRDPAYRELARRLFDRFPCPVLEITLRCRKGTWRIADLRVRSHIGLSDADETAFAEALNAYSRRVWRKSRARRRLPYDLAMLVDRQEQLPPSNAAALRKFIRAGAELGIDVEVIGPRDYAKLPEYDALFIRATTAVDHYTYRFAKRAEAEGLVVVDDPTSILRCTNKIYLADLFGKNRVPAPRTRILRQGDGAGLAAAERELGYPMVIKVPDGSFSRGVVKVADRAELAARTAELFEKSALLLAQEFLYTQYDWRIGVFDGRPIFACRYYMVRDHWQIYRHGAGRVASGGFDTLPTFEVPRPVLDAAVAATRPIGNGLYGVDVKESNGRGYVIEVNDNPNIDAGVEDAYLGDELYRLVMAEFLRRLQHHRAYGR